MIFDCYKPTFARRFVAASSHSLDNGSAVLTAAPLTMVCWFVSDSATANQTLISIGNTGSDTNYFRLMIRGDAAGDPVRMVSRAGTEQFASTSTGFSTGTWHHACGVEASATDRSAFIDGGGKGTNTASRVPSSLNATAVGTLTRATPVEYMSGLIAWPAIWNVALTDAEVYILSRGAHPSTVRPESLVAFWDFTGREVEYGLRGDYPLTNSGSLPVHGPGFLQTRIPRPWLLGAGSQAGGGGGGNRRRRVITGAAA